MLKRELKINLKSLLLWTGILLISFILIYLVYPSLVNEDVKVMLKQMIDTMPKEILTAFNMDIVGIETPFGWFKTEGYVFIALICSLYSAILGSTILVKEENDKTIVFLYARPLTRNKIVTAKILTGFINIGFMCVVLFFGNLFGLLNSEDFNFKTFLLIFLSAMFLQFLFFFITLLISTFFTKTTKAMSIAIFLVIGSYIMQIIGGMGESVKIIKDISLFEFASSRYIILNNHINYFYLIIGIIIIGLSIFFTYYRYQKKEFNE